MSRKILMLGFAVALAISGESSRGQSKESAAVTGTVAYLQRTALPPDAVVTVQLQDVSLQDAPAKIIAEVKVPTAGKQVPISFRIPYSPADINPSHSYAVRANIIAGGDMMFTSTTSYPVITRGAPTEVAVMVQPVSADSSLSSSHKATPKLEGTAWKLVELGGNPVVASPDSQEANIVLNADEQRLSGSSGCNRLVGGYYVRRRSLHFTPAGLTRMACPEPLMKQEQAFVEALKATTSYRIVGQTLELRDKERVLARFESSSASTPSANPPNAPAAATTPSEKWLGQWNGPEGTYLLLSKNSDEYVIKIRSLDRLKTYEGIPAGDRIQFTRDGKTESIRAGSGQETGMKWLMDKKNCLIIKAGEGFCRD